MRMGDKPTPSSGNALQALLLEGKALLQKGNVEQALLEAELLAAHILKKDRTWLAAHKEEVKVTEAFLAAYYGLLERRSKSEPLAYITGQKEFYDRFFYVNPQCLIPRFESEELSEKALHLPLPSQANVLDLCCGSGCIGLSILLEKKDIRIDFSDISEGALELCAKNAHALIEKEEGLSREDRARLKQSCNFYQSDLFCNVPHRRYDLIVANPPYVLAEEYEQLPDEIRLHEPVEALLCLEPLDFSRRLWEGIRDYIAPQGFALVESSPSLRQLCLDTAPDYGLSIQSQKDLAGRWRFFFLSPMT